MICYHDYAIAKETVCSFCNPFNQQEIVLEKRNVKPTQSAKKELKELLNTQNEAIKKILSHGFLNLYEAPDYTSFFKWKDEETNITYLRFIIDLVFLNYDQIKLDKQPRDSLNKERVEILSALLKTEKLKYPGIATVYNKNIYLEAGFHRTKAQEESDKIPIVIVSEPYYMDDNGSLQKVQPSIVKLSGDDAETIATNSGECVAIFCRASTNPRADTEPMSIDSWGHCLHKAFNEDRTFVGRNPSGEVPESIDDDSWKKIMTMPGMSNYASTRSLQGRVLASWRRFENLGGADTKEDIDDSYITDQLKNLNWSVGLDPHKGVRKSFLEHKDLSNDAYILSSYDDGNNIDYNLSKIYAAYRKGEIEHSRILALLRIYKSPISLNRLNNKRWSLIRGVVTEYNLNVLELRKIEGIGQENQVLASEEMMPLIEEVFMMPQLRTPKDQGLNVQWDSKSKKFVLKQANNTARKVA